MYGNNPATEFLRNASAENVAHSEETVNLIVTDEQNNVTDEQNNVLATELPGGMVSVDTARYSLFSFNEQERDRVRQALYNATNDDGTKRFTKQDVDKYTDDAMGIAAKIAQNRTRLDFKANAFNSFLKSNQDYFFSLDASIQSDP